MDKRKDDETASGKPVASPDGALEQAQTQNETAKEIASEIKSELPNVESPPLSPGEPASAVEPIAETDIAPATRRRFAFNFDARQKRNGLLAASVALAAALGAVVGAVASGGFGAPLARTEVAGNNERKAMQQSIARLAKEVTTLKSNLDAANRSAHTQIAKISDRLNRESAEITGSISAPKTIVPAPRTGAVANPPAVRTNVVPGWIVRGERDGYVYVQGHGDIYQVVPGAPLPGLGPVQSVKRQDGRWVVVTPKGIIVSLRDRRYFGSY